MRPFDLEAAKAGAKFIRCDEDPAYNTLHAIYVGRTSCGGVVYEQAGGGIYVAMAESLVMLLRPVTKWRWVRDNGISITPPRETEDEARADAPLTKYADTSYIKHGGVPHLAKIGYEV